MSHKLPKANADAIKADRQRMRVWYSKVKLTEEFYAYEALFIDDSGTWCSLGEKPKE